MDRRGRLVGDAGEERAVSLCPPCTFEDHWRCRDGQCECWCRLHPATLIISDEKLLSPVSSGLDDEQVDRFVLALAQGLAVMALVAIVVYLGALGVEALVHAGGWVRFAAALAIGGGLLVASVKEPKR